MQNLKKDSFILGAILGIAIPLIIYGFILLINFILVQMGITQIYLDQKIHVLISLTGNLLPIRYYFVTLKFDKTGRGVLLITFILMMLFFVLKDRIL
jgi:hypothetical protein